MRPSAAPWVEGGEQWTFETYQAGVSEASAARQVEIGDQRGMEIRQAREASAARQVEVGLNGISDAQSPSK